MTPKAINDEMLKRYLLGSLSEDEQIQVQERFLADHESFEQLKLIEDDLIDEYVQNKLSKVDRRHFEMYYRVTPERRQKVEFAEDLQQALTIRQRSNWLRFVLGQWRAVLDFFATPHPALKSAYALGGIVLFIGGSALLVTTIKLRGELEQLRSEQLTLMAREQKLQEQMSRERESNKQLNEQLSREREQRHELQKQLAISPSPQASTVSFVLVTDLIRRASGETKRLIVPKDIAFVQLRLVLENEVEHKNYRAVFATAVGDQIWSEDIKNAAGKAVVVQIPAKIFASDDYTITLFDMDASGTLEEVGEYFFPVRKQ